MAQSGSWTTSFNFTLEHRLTAGAARAGWFETAHGKVLTPVFMPVATHAAVRGQHTQTLADLKYPVLLANTYHLLLRPGCDVFRQFGGIHRYMNWQGAVLTDSGGYQIFSLPQYSKMSEAGAEFRSYIDGQRILLTPESSIETQRTINSDIMMVLDHCLPAGAPADEVEAALELTHRWAIRSLEAKGDSKQALFAIVQGGCIPEFREKSAAQLTVLPFDGFAIGGVAVGEERPKRDAIVRYTAQLLPENKPRYLMGVGTPLDLLEAVSAGIDMFDCILPTALAQQGVCFTQHGKINLRRGVYRLADEPIDSDCLCSTCQSYSRSYLHHLNKTGEYLAGTLIGIHNLTFYKRFMERMRQEILNDTFNAFYEQSKEELARTDEANPAMIQLRKKIVSKSPEEIGKYKLSRRGDSVSIAHISSGEVMHSVSDPMVEAERLYVSQSHLRQRLINASATPLTLWDVGLGAATNAMAAVLAYEALANDSQALAPLHIVSFENDLDALRLALKNLEHFPQLRHEAAHKILHLGRWASKKGDLTWNLYEGDFLQTMAQAPAPHLIFFDPFSYKTDSSLWTLKTFTKIFKHSLKGQTELFTYSASTSVRAALLAAGFYLAKGVGTGPKEETTIAIAGSPDHLNKDSKHGWKRAVLGREWLDRWERSDNPMPLDADDKANEIARQIRSHPQFQR